MPARPLTAITRPRRLQFHGVAVGVLDVERGTVGLGAVALDDLAAFDAVRGKVRAQRRLVERFETDAEMVEIMAFLLPARRRLRGRACRRGVRDL